MRSIYCTPKDQDQMDVMLAAIKAKGRLRSRKEEWGPAVGQQHLYFHPNRCEVVVIGDKELEYLDMTYTSPKAFISALAMHLQEVHDGNDISEALKQLELTPNA